MTMPDVTAPPLRRCAIVGTAQTWTQAPWPDTGIDILSLNDAYLLALRKWGTPSLPRATVWFDLHPFHEMRFRPATEKKTSPWEVPTGAYLRPDGHLDWLRTRPHPVYLHTAPPGWPTAQTFPRQEIEAKHGAYFTSTPAWMLVWAIEQGYQEIHIYGIHLSTEWEYIEQRPCFEYWLRYAIDRGIKIVLPTRCPLLKSKRIYAYEPKYDLPLKAQELEVGKIKQIGAGYRKALTSLRWYQRQRTRDLLSRLEVANLELHDAREVQRRLQMVLSAE